MPEYDSYGDPVEEIKNDGSGGNFLTKKYGPLPVWGWTILGAGSLYLLYRYGILGGTGTGSATTTSNTTLPASTSDITSGGDSGQSPEEISGIQDIWDALATINDTLVAQEPIAAIEPSTPAPITPAPISLAPGSWLIPGTGKVVDVPAPIAAILAPIASIVAPVAPVAPVIAPIAPINLPTLITHKERESLYDQWIKSLPKNSSFTKAERTDSAWWARYKEKHNVKEK